MNLTLTDIPLGTVVALLAAAGVRIVVGWIWYAPPVFGKAWMRLVGVTSDQTKAGLGKSILVDFIGSFVMAFVLAHAVYHVGVTTVTGGAVVGLVIWLGFIATVTLAMTMYEKRPLTLFLINNGFQLISITIMGAILAAWRK